MHLPLVTSLADPCRVRRGSFGGPTLWENPHFISPNKSRATHLSKKANRYDSRQDAKQTRAEYVANEQVPKDELATVFDDAGPMEVDDVEADGASSSSSARGTKIADIEGAIDADDPGSKKAAKRARRKAKKQAAAEAIAEAEAANASGDAGAAAGSSSNSSSSSSSSSAASSKSSKSSGNGAAPMEDAESDAGGDDAGDGSDGADDDDDDDGDMDDLGDLDQEDDDE